MAETIIREDFPIFRDNPSLVYLDNAATTQKPSCVIEAVRHFYERDNANPLRGLYDLAQRATAGRLWLNSSARPARRRSSLRETPRRA